MKRLIDLGPDDVVLPRIDPFDSAVRLGAHYGLNIVDEQSFHSLDKYGKIIK